MKIVTITECLPWSKACEVRARAGIRCFYGARELAKKRDVTAFSPLEPTTPGEQAFAWTIIVKCGIAKEHRQTGGLKIFIV